jgi:phosphoribosyl 1,2-cyclic phosphodiesterase
MTPGLIDNFIGSDLVLLESNHDISMLKAGRYPYPLKMRILGESGHLSNDAASLVIAELAKKGTKQFILGHLSKENNYPALAYETVKALLTDEGIITGKDVLLDVASRKEPGKMVVI